MNPYLNKLHAYPFTKLAALLSNVDVQSNSDAIAMTIGEPQHAPPKSAIDALVAELSGLNKYPSTQGGLPLRESIAAWLCRRYKLPLGSVDPATMVLPVVGSREALFAIAQTVVDSSASVEPPIVIIPSPFYQIYEGAAIMAGAEPLYLPCDNSNDYVPDLDSVTEAQWQRCQLMYICNPSNPTGAVPTREFYQRLLELADRYDFVIASDECYSEIYFDELSPPPGLLEVCHDTGRENFSRCLVFNSLSKRSNLAGMRSGFVAGCQATIKAFMLYRTYHGSAMPNHHQAASIVAWDDESHVQENRVLYREKMRAVVPILQQVMSLEIPAAGFCLWAKLPIDDEHFAQTLYREQHVKVLPGQYLARTVNDYNPGAGYSRLALVHSLDVCVEAAERIVACVSEHNSVV